MVEVVEINRLDELESFRAVWEKLHQQTDGASFFQSLDWLMTYWRYFGHSQKLRVIVVYDNGPIGIVPLTVISEQLRVGSVSVLTYPLHDWGSFFGPIGPNPTATLTAALEHVRTTPRDWDLLDLRWIHPGLSHQSTHSEALQASGLGARESIWKQTSLIDMTGTWDDYLSSRSTKFRSHIRRQERRMARLGEVRHERYRPNGLEIDQADTCLAQFDSCVELARRSWQGKSTTGTTLSHDSVHDYLRETHRLAARAGAVDINVLKLNDRPVAFAYNYHSGGSVTGLRIGFDADYTHGGIGTVLLARMIRDSFQRDDHTFDLGSGYENIKKTWRTNLLDIYRYTHYPLWHPRAQLLRMKHWLNDRRRNNLPEEGKGGQARLFPSIKRACPPFSRA